MISYWSSRHGHTCPAINCFKGHLRHFHYLIGIVVLFLSGCCMSCILLLAYVSIHFQSLQSIITDDEKHYQCQNIVLNNKPRSLFLEFNWWINNCLHRWERYSWECWQRHDMTRDNSTFRECSPLRTRSSFKRLLRNQCRLSTCVVRSFLYLDTDFVNNLFRASQCYLFRRRTLFRVFLKPHKDIQGF